MAGGAKRRESKSVVPVNGSPSLAPLAGDDTLRFHYVMAGLVPAIPILEMPRFSHRDHRHKAGDDERVSFPAGAQRRGRESTPLP